MWLYPKDDYCPHPSLASCISTFLVITLLCYHYLTMVRPSAICQIAILSMTTQAVVIAAQRNPSETQNVVSYIRDSPSGELAIDPRNKETKKLNYSQKRYEQYDQGTIKDLSHDREDWVRYLAVIDNAQFERLTEKIEQMSVEEEEGKEKENNGPDEVGKNSYRFRYVPLFSSLAYGTAKFEKVPNLIGSDWEEQDQLQDFTKATVNSYNELPESKDGEEKESNSHLSDDFAAFLVPSNISKFDIPIVSPLKTINFNNLDATQRQWLENNAIRRTEIIQDLLQGKDIDAKIKMDKIEYENGNIFLNPDDNYYTNGANPLSAFSSMLLITSVMTQLAFSLL